MELTWNPHKPSNECKNHLARADCMDKFAQCDAFRGGFHGRTAYNLGEERQSSFLPAAHKPPGQAFDCTNLQNNSYR